MEIARSPRSACRSLAPDELPEKRSFCWWKERSKALSEVFTPLYHTWSGRQLWKYTNFLGAQKGQWPAWAYMVDADRLCAQVSGFVNPQGGG